MTADDDDDDDDDLRPTIYLTLKVLKISRELTANTEELHHRLITSHCLVYDLANISRKLGYQIDSHDLVLSVFETSGKPFMGKDKPGRNRKGLGFGLGYVEFEEALAEMRVVLPPDSFSHFWAMAETGYMVENLPPRIEVSAETSRDHSKRLNVTKFTLAASREFGQESHPVVAELRAMAASGRSLLYKIFAAFLVIWIVMIILDWLRH